MAPERDHLGIPIPQYRGDINAIFRGRSGCQLITHRQFRRRARRSQTRLGDAAGFVAPSVEFEDVGEAREGWGGEGLRELELVVGGAGHVLELSGVVACYHFEGLLLEREERGVGERVFAAFETDTISPFLLIRV